MSDTILAIDLGGTRYRAGRSTRANPAAIEAIGEWPAPMTRDSFLEMVRSQIDEIGATRLGIGVPGLATGTTCRWVPNLPYLDGLNLAEVLPGFAIGLGNDAQLALLAEVAAGSAKGLNDVVLLAIGTGIGSAVMTGGRIVSGSAGGACSFGWAAADLDDPGEDRSGWLERHASGRALDAAAQSIGLTSGSALVDAARQGEAIARRALEPPARALGTALAGAVALLDPQAIIIAGGVAASLDVLEPMILEPLHRQLPPHLRGIRLRPSEFGPRAGIVGASFAGAAGPAWRNHNG
jgi:glucokinase